MLFVCCAMCVNSIRVEQDIDQGPFIFVCGATHVKSIRVE
jgi:hypothetical protein